MNETLCRRQAMPGLDSAVVFREVQPKFYAHHHDHRVLLALSVAAMATPGHSLLEDFSWVAKSFPNYVIKMQSLGANIEVAAVQESIKC